MGAVSQLSDGISHAVNSTTNAISGALGTDGGNKGLLQGSLQGTSDAISNAGKDIAKSPLAQAAITAGGAAFGIPPWMTASALGVNRTAQDGNILAGLTTGLSSYAGGKAVNNFIMGGNTSLSGALGYGGKAALGEVNKATLPRPSGSGAAAAALGLGALAGLAGSSTGGGGGGSGGAPSVLVPGADGVYTATGAPAVATNNADAQALRSRVNSDLAVLDTKREKLGDAAFRDSRIASTMADVQGKFDSSQAESNRMLARMGVSPNSGRFAAAAGKNAIGLASAQAGAANNERRAMDKEEIGYLTAGADMARSGLQTAAGLDSDAQRVALAQDQANKQYQLGLMGANTASYDAETKRMKGNSDIAAQQNKDDPLRTIAGAAVGGYTSNQDFRDFVNGGLSSGWGYVSGLFNSGTGGGMPSLTDAAGVNLYSDFFYG
jgi:hypothetical protein